VIKTLSSAEFVVTDADKGVVYKLALDGQDLFASIHVDDFKTSASPCRSSAYDIKDELFSVLNAKYSGIVVQRGPKYRHLAYDIVYEMAAGVVEESSLSCFRRTRSLTRSVILHVPLYSQHVSIRSR
jgi:hypothetical protein